MSELALGTYAFGRYTKQPECAAIVDRYLEAGGNFFDTANVYSRGEAEELLGRLLARHRDKVVVATKVGLPIRTDSEPALSRTGIIRDLEGSLRRLNSDWVDIYLVHWPDERVDQEETFEALGQLAVAGKIRSVGVSNYTGTKLAQALAICDHGGLPRPSVVQQQYSLVCRDSDVEMLPLCISEEVSVCAWSPLSRGLLAGSSSTRALHPVIGTTADATKNRKLKEVAKAVRGIAAEVGRSPAQVALNWVRQRPGITAPVLGVSNCDQLDDSLQALEWELDETHVAQLSQLTAPYLPYPHNMYEEIGIHRYV